MTLGQQALVLQNHNKKVSVPFLLDEYSYHFRHAVIVGDGRFAEVKCRMQLASLIFCTVTRNVFTLSRQ